MFYVDHESNMNIFYLHSDPVVCAEYHCNSHVVKMILEYAQILSTAHRIIDNIPYSNDDILYKKTHYNHPSMLWARNSSHHYEWLYKLFISCCDEYTKRYGKVHKTDAKLRQILKFKPNNIIDNGWIDPPLCMPDYCKKSNAIESYRNYYNKEKQSFAEWKFNTPEWFHANQS